MYILISTGSHMIRRVRERELTKYNLSPTEVAVLRYSIETQGQATPSYMSRRLLREPHSMSALVTRMEKKGLIKKTADLERKNVLRVRLTPEGNNAFIEAMRLESVMKLMSCLSKEECQQLRSILTKLVRQAVGTLGVPAIWPGVLDEETPQVKRPVKKIDLF